MNPLAQELNKTLQEKAPIVFSMLSDLGVEMFFPKGILFQSAQAKEKASKFNATIGTATEKGFPMHLNSTIKYFNGLDAKDIFPYAPPLGRAKLRDLWKAKQLKENPSLEGKGYSNPAVTAAITHGLTLVGDLFANEGDIIISPDQLWGNYRLIYQTRRGAKIVSYNMFKGEGLDIDAFIACLAEQAKTQEKLIVMLNFPNNPTGYTPTVAEGQAIADAIKAQAEKGTKIVTISDDSYFGLFYEDSMKQSIFGLLADVHENVLAIKLDGATKEDYAWGFRTGFITFAYKGADADVYTALEKKVAGDIRGMISNCNHASQTIIEKMLDDPEFPTDHKNKYDLMKARALAVKEVLKDPKYKDTLKAYPFNSGYFMCLETPVDAEELRMHLLNKYGVGVIANNATDLRIAFSCIESQDIPELYDIIHQGIVDLLG